ncbi:MAG TPA: DUF1214 domain-containing protein [Afifellaceae bacterium]|nr:DUF1214 domain-containing protein [Afifellaceae bacterium]
MSRLTVISLIAAVSLALGLGSAWMAAKATAPVDSLRLGSWSTWPNAGTEETDPYSRARMARNGELPLGAGEGLALYGEIDSDAAPLNGECTYLIEGQTPPARLWTLGLETQGGQPLAAVDTITAIGSDSIVRLADGSFRIVVSPLPRAGNWLSSAGAGRIRIVVRLYDTTARTLTELTDFSVPNITRESCP